MSRRLLAEAVATHLLVRLGLGLLDTGRLRALMGWLGRRRLPPARAGRGPVLRAVAQSSRWVPRSTCLSTALTGRVLCTRRGVATRLRIGVARAAGRMQAHAWVEGEEGEVLVGDTGDLERYTRLVPAAGQRWL